jgi:uncharacterized protein YkwD
VNGRSAIALASAATALAALGVAGGVDAQPAEAATAGSVKVERALVKEMNRARARHGLSGLRARAKLTQPARSHSSYLMATGRFAHEGPGGAPFWARLVAAGNPRTKTLGENLAMASGCGVGAARQAVRMWLESPGHRANLLHPRFRFAGAGVAVAQDCSTMILTADYSS